MTVAFGGGVSVSVGGAARTVSPTGPLVVSTGLLASVALMVRVTVAATVGVPLMTQAAPRVSPAGRVPATIEQL